MTDFFPTAVVRIVRSIPISKTAKMVILKMNGWSTSKASQSKQLSAKIRGLFRNWKMGLGNSKFWSKNETLPRCLHETEDKQLDYGKCRSARRTLPLICPFYRYLSSGPKNRTLVVFAGMAVSAVTGGNSSYLPEFSYNFSLQEFVVPKIYSGN